MKVLKNIVVLLAVMFSIFASATDLPAGPIWNQQDAQVKCPNVCRSGYLIWNGNWRTTVPNRMSVCGCDESKDFDAGPIWNQQDAQVKCPNVCVRNNLQWNGQWVTTVPGRMSVCGCIVPR